MAIWPPIVTPAMIFGTGCFADFVLSTAVHGPNIERALPACAGLMVGTLTVLTFAKRRDAYLVAAALFTAVALIAVTLAASLALRASLCAACLIAVGASLASYAVVPEQKRAPARSESRDERSRR
ncbi:MAG: hypothetical protein ACR2JW_14500 [Thermomicrobiales bacterium]